MQKIIVSLLALILVACGSLPEKKASLNHPSEMQNWTLQGKIGVKALGESQSANFHWQNSDQQGYTIRVHGPLGQGAAKLERDFQGVSFEADGVSQRATTAEELMSMNLGWSFPVDAMSWWVRGLPAPQLEIQREQLNEQGLLSELEQGGWTIQYTRYQLVGGLNLPAKLLASRHEHRVEVKLLLKKWDF
ncbi:outer membrane lipoprotein LolB [Alteromonadaceae bacterium Bs31]|nr:outer membrane lipoprotein LolB [Alteromonadaceae bacterium Bs31]